MAHEGDDPKEDKFVPETEEFESAPQKRSKFNLDIDSGELSEGERELSDEEVQDRIKELRQKEPMARLFKPGVAKMLAALIDCPVDLSPTGICNNAGVTRTTWYDHRDMLIEFNLIHKTRDAGNSPMYDLADSAQAKAIVRLNSALYEALE